MSDLVKRLRATEPSYVITNEAADRIERLEAALRAACAVLSGEAMSKSELIRAMELARAALQDDKQEKPAPNPPPRSANGLEPQF